MPLWEQLKFFSSDRNLYEATHQLLVGQQDTGWQLSYDLCIENIHGVATSCR